jgi:hypothetical protein
MITKTDILNEEKIFNKVKEMGEKKDKKGLDLFCDKFLKKGAFWLGRNKNEKDDWLYIYSSFINYSVGRKLN